MIFVLICLCGLVFVALTLPGALRRRSGKTNRIPPVINNVTTTSPFWRKDPCFSPLARDRLEVLEIWEKCTSDPNFPGPIPPTKPHPYFGDESGPDKID
jgi:hypothetical protein